MQQGVFEVKSTNGYISKAVTPKKTGVRLTGMVETKRFSNSSNSTMGLPAWITGFAPD
jgi:hypothetical protein